MTTRDELITLRGLLLTAIDQLIDLDDTDDANAENMEEYNRRIREIGSMASTLFGVEHGNMTGAVGVPTLSVRKLEKLIHVIEELEFDKMSMDRIFDESQPR